MKDEQKAYMDAVMPKVMQALGEEGSSLMEVGLVVEALQAGCFAYISKEAVGGKSVMEASLTKLTDVPLSHWIPMPPQGE